LGGSQNDGLNLGAGLNHNYADLARGEIDIDNWNNIYIATTTFSSNFPTSANAIQSGHGGGYDGVVLKMDNSLTTLIWSTYLGGSSSDAVFSLAVDKQNNIIVTGGTTSSNFPVVGTNFQAYSGGVDAFVTIINSAGTQMIRSILYGTDKYDQAYFVELDNKQNIFLLGQTDATNGYFYSGTSFGVENGAQFITKFNPDLSIRDWSTTFGNQNGHSDISPTAFLVDVCSKIYISGWGGSVNGTVPGSSVVGLPITPDAYQSTPHNNDFYIMVIQDDATALSYATYYGGANSPEHVDGGTSRFNRKGEIYQSVCAGCGGFHDFPTTPDAWSTTNNGTVINPGGQVTSNGCNNGVFKFLLDFPSMVADFEVPPSVCAPSTVTFPNYSSGATDYFWDLGNGQTSTSASPTASYAESGIYTVKLVANNTDGTTCNLTDTVIKQIVVLGKDAQNLPDTGLCVGGSIEIGIQPISDPTVTFTWIPSTGLSDPNASNPIFNSAVGTQTYQLIISNSVCSDTITQHVLVSVRPVLSLNDTIVCAGTSFPVGFQNPDPTMLFNWNPGHLLSDSTIANPIFNNPQQTTTTFYLEYGYIGCKSSLDRQVGVLDRHYFNVNDTLICLGDTAFVNELTFYPDLTYAWTPAQWVSNPGIYNPVFYPPSSQDYQVTITNGICFDTLVKHIEVVERPAVAGMGDTICVGQSLVIGPDDPLSFLNYKWTPSSSLSNSLVPNPTATPTNTTTYIVNVHAAGNPNGCVSSDTLTVVVSNPGGAGFTFGEVAGCYAMEVNVKPIGSSSHQYQWFTNNGQTGTGLNPYFSAPYDSTVIFSMVVTGEGCTDTISIPHTFGTFESMWGQLVMPNIFTPNDDDVNECFGPAGAPEGCYWLYIYNRWGMLMFDSEKVGQSCWNGNYMKTNTKVVDGVYFWVLGLGTTEHHGTVTVSGKGGH